MLGAKLLEHTFHALADRVRPEDTHAGLERARFAVGQALAASRSGQKSPLFWPSVGAARRSILDLPIDANLDDEAIMRAYEALGEADEESLLAAYSELAGAEERLWQCRR